MTSPTLVELQRLAQAAAARYMVQFSWVDGAELVQEALVALLTARNTYDPARGEFNPYGYQAACSAIRNFIWRFRVPLTIGWEHREAALKIDTVPVDTIAHRIPCAERLLSLQIHASQLSARTRARLKHLDRSGGTALRVVLGEATPSEIARRTGVKVTEIYKATERLRREARCDPTLRDLWKEL